MIEGHHNTITQYSLAARAPPQVTPEYKASKCEIGNFILFWFMCTRAANINLCTPRRAVWLFLCLCL